MTTRADVVAEARRWIGTRFQHQGRVRGVGVDCVGLVIGVARELLLVPESFDITGYGRQPDGMTFQDYCDSHMIQSSKEAAVPGNVVSIAFNKHPMHLAILADYAHGGLSIIHALASSRKCIEQRLDEVWMSRIAGWHRLVGVA